MNVEIGAEAALFPEKEYINGIFFAVWRGAGSPLIILVIMMECLTWQLATPSQTQYANPPLGPGPTYSTYEYRVTPELVVSVSKAEALGQKP
jgi:hypothetical protein